MGGPVRADTPDEAPVPHPAPRPPRPLFLAAALLLAAGCAAPAGESADRASSTAPPRELSAAELRAAAVTEADLGPGFTVTVITPGRGATGPDGGREAADKPACQPLLDSVAPAPAAGRAGASASAPPVSAVPSAETDLSVALAGDPAGSLYGALLGYPGDRAARLHAELEGLFGPCAEFASTAPPPPAEKGRGATRTVHRLSRNDTPTPEGADAATGFTLTNESGSVVLAQRAVLARVGPALVVFSTVGVGAEPAPAPDERVVRRQVARLRAAQRG
ncbi:hypothetical protein ABZW10_02555 [Kitasatospora sp. NPDC004723]|uniref:hypothetical protein n=1 Tax=Kitasatospora sp. NPDC004723 TaxID=3154288 RepID=UPI00339E9150